MGMVAGEEWEVVDVRSGELFVVGLSCSQYCLPHTTPPPPPQNRRYTEKFGPLNSIIRLQNVIFIKVMNDGLGLGI